MNYESEEIDRRRRFFCTAARTVAALASDGTTRDAAASDGEVF
jgi:hypothetical protein